MIISFVLGGLVAKGTVVQPKAQVLDKPKDKVDQLMDEVLAREAELNANRAKQMVEAMNWNGKPTKEAINE